MYKVPESKGSKYRTNTEFLCLSRMTVKFKKMFNLLPSLKKVTNVGINVGV